MSKSASTTASHPASRKTSSPCRLPKPLAAEYLPMLMTVHEAVWMVCEYSENLGNLFLGAVGGDISATMDAIEAEEPDIHTDALWDDVARLERDSERMGLIEGPGLAALLRLALAQFDRLKAAA
jgi:hypothetical protein